MILDKLNCERALAHTSATDNDKLQKPCETNRTSKGKHNTLYSAICKRTESSERGTTHRFEIYFWTKTKKTQTFALQCHSEQTTKEARIRQRRSNKQDFF
jgi:hypothetical protein